MKVAAILAAAGLEAGPAQRLSGGDIAAVWRVGDLVVKTHPKPPAGLFPAEAAGLRALAAGGMRVPGVHWVGEAGLVLEYLPPGPPRWEDLAVRLAALHAAPAPGYGWPDPTYLAVFPLPAGVSPTWSEVWVDRRVRPLLEATSQTLGGELTGRVRDLLDRFEPPREGPVLLHGDLWGGNVHMSTRGAAVIDPSAWWGERGVDLAMMKLFGGFPAPFWRAYEQACPIPAAVTEAITYYQLYYLLVHVWLFGATYVSGVRSVVDRYPVR